MRNLAKYPITKDEILFSLDEHERAFDHMQQMVRGDERLVGDIRPAALDRARDIVREYYGSLWRDPVWLFGMIAGAMVGGTVTAMIFLAITP